ncbi:hypothetical protein [Mesorhizobium sp. B2-7-2]|uniref:hypothetical protein n=1 Tax=Mesorhizobium sp. B2-7-2 TaxID=2589908 RepID=UPI001FEDF1A8|nr:hypothetical protein [Mesorhizobium sp. B2-7-2]
MADSDNTTTLPSVTLGREMQFPLTKKRAGPSAEARLSPDPALLLSLAWIDAHVGMLASCVREQQEEEERLLDHGAPLPTGALIGRGEGASADCGDLDAREQDDAEKADTLLADLVSTPAQSLAGVIAKLAVVVREAKDNTDIFEFPLPHIRSALADLRRLTQDAICDQPAGWPAGDQSIGALLEQPASSFAAWRAFDAWSQGDDEAYRAWTNTFKTLHGARQ